MVLHTSVTLLVMDQGRAPAVLPPANVGILRLTAHALTVLTMERLNVGNDQRDKNIKGTVVWGPSLLPRHNPRSIILP